MKHGENTVLPGTVVWLAVSEDSVSLLELRSMQLIETYMFGQVLTFGGCQDDFMLVIASDSAIIESHKLLFSLSKPKVSKIDLGVWSLVLRKSVGATDSRFVIDW